ncbi:MAG: hypothetical protein JJU11_01845 [Candidatus Sumerlaeia bacterium]|nr:hypothetical protein [Candidatus Sumerlaeia bacterium]
MDRFFLATRFEQAVMALAIKQANEVFANKPNGGFLGRTALQKIMYFLVRKGVPLPYGFEIYHYGPFCSEIYHDVECLQAEGVVQDRGPSERYWNYTPGPRMDLLILQFEKELSPYLDSIQEVAALFADLRPEVLELIATLDYIFQDEQARQGKPPEKLVVVDRFISVKKDKFKRVMVENKFDTLQKSGIFLS